MDRATAPREEVSRSAPLSAMLGMGDSPDEEGFLLGALVMRRPLVADRAVSLSHVLAFWLSVSVLSMSGISFVLFEFGA